MTYALKAPMKDQTIIVKVSLEERELIQEKANAHSGGNVSKWIREASTLYCPTDTSDDPTPIAS